MKRLSLLLLALVTCGGITTAHADDSQSDLIARGAYLARAGDCTACHTASGGQPFAGGYKISSAIGTIYSTNITPSKSAGIGNYTEQQFAGAVRQGIRADGSRLYPAMPYPDYRGISDDDIHALYVYFMQGVKPVDTAPPATDLSFPFSQRWGMRFWNMVFTDDKPFQADSGKNDEVNRGKYLVETLGHCSSCHTPRGFAMQEKSLNDSEASFLSGSDLNGWPVPGLRHMDGWSEQDIADYLGSGRNRFASVGGEMTSVVSNSLQYLNDQDLLAIAKYLKSLPDDAPIGNLRQDQDNATQQTTALLTAGKNLTQGQLLYLNNCEACHWTNGKGAPGIFPALNGSDIVRQNNPTALISTILHGAHTPSTVRAPSVLFMPGFASRLSNQQVAELATFIRNGWGNHAPTVSESDVEKVAGK